MTPLLDPRCLAVARRICVAAFGGVSAAEPRNGSRRSSQPRRRSGRPIRPASNSSKRRSGRCLVARCHECHGPTKQKGNLRLDSRAAVLEGRRHRAGRRAGQARREPAGRRDSLWRHVSDAPQVATAGRGDRHAGRMGAAWARRGDARRRRRRTAASRRRRSTWQRAPSTGAFSRSPTVDAARGGRRGLGQERPSIDLFWPGSKRPASSPRRRPTSVTLLRRVTYDLIGLPPTPAEIEAFLADDSPAGLRDGRRSAAGVAPLRRTLGPALARPGALRRDAMATSSTSTCPTPIAIATT